MGLPEIIKAWQRGLVTACLALLLAVGYAVAGCMRQRPTLDEEIEALPDEWSFSSKTGVSSNNYAVLNRIGDIGDVSERVRLTWKIFDHFRHTPEWHVLHHREDGARYEWRNIFLSNCAWNLIMGTNATPETIIEGWKIRSEILKDWEEILRLTGPEWQEQVRKRLDLRIKEDLERHGIASSYSPELNFAYEVRRAYDMFFRCSFAGYSSYRALPDEMKPVFVELLKRDFFTSSGMTNVNMRDYPPQLKAAYREVRDRQRMEQPSRQNLGQRPSGNDELNRRISLIRGLPPNVRDYGERLVDDICAVSNRDEQAALMGRFAREVKAMSSCGLDLRLRCQELARCRLMTEIACTGYRRIGGHSGDIWALRNAMLLRYVNATNECHMEWEKIEGHEKARGQEKTASGLSHHADTGQGQSSWLKSMEGDMEHYLLEITKWLYRVDSHRLSAEDRSSVKAELERIVGKKLDFTEPQ